MWSVTQVYLSCSDQKSTRISHVSFELLLRRQTAKACVHILKYLPMNKTIRLKGIMLLIIGTMLAPSESCPAVLVISSVYNVSPATMLFFLLPFSSVWMIGFWWQKVFAVPWFECKSMALEDIVNVGIMLFVLSVYRQAHINRGNAQKGEVGPDLLLTFTGKFLRYFHWVRLKYLWKRTFADNLTQSLFLIALLVFLLTNKNDLTVVCFKFPFSWNS